MSLLSTLSPYPGSRKIKQRLGRGRGSGRGGTSGKGHKGQRARSGVRIARGFEGGALPLSRRLPKFGFTNARFKKKWDIVNLSRLSSWDQEIMDAASLKRKGFVSGQRPIKILAGAAGGKSVFKKPVTVKAHKFSAKACEWIEKAGGKAISIPAASKSGSRKNQARFEKEGRSRPENKKGRILKDKK